MACTGESEEDSGFSLPDMSFTKTSVLVRAIYFEDIHQVQFLLRTGCNPNKAVGDKKVRPLMVACFVKNDSKRLSIVRYLKWLRANPNLTDRFGRNALMYACAMRLEEELNILLNDVESNFYDTDIYGNTLIHICSKYGNINVLELVLEKMLKISMDINIYNKSGHTALDEALLQGNIPCAKKLCSIGGQSTLSDSEITPCFSLLASRSVKVPRLVDFNRVRNLPVALKAKPSTANTSYDLLLPKIPARKDIISSLSEQSTSTLLLPLITNTPRSLTAEIQPEGQTSALVHLMKDISSTPLYHTLYDKKSQHKNVTQAHKAQIIPEWAKVSQEDEVTDSLITHTPVQQMVSLRRSLYQW